jgi:hypothetical protein
MIRATSPTMQIAGGLDSVSLFLVEAHPQTCYITDISILGAQQLGHLEVCCLPLQDMIFRTVTVCFKE